MRVLASKEARKLAPKGWRVKGRTLKLKTLNFKTFMNCIRFVNEIAKLAEKADHHPDISIKWKYLDLKLTTHDYGGITSNDIAMANRINKLLERWKDKMVRPK